MSAQWQLQEQGTCLTNRFIFFPPGIIAFFFFSPFPLSSWHIQITSVVAVK